MNKAAVFTALNNFAPPELAESWDCSGVIVETCNNKINKIMLALTVTDDVVLQAEQQDCDIIISHHPLFFVPFKYKDIDIFCSHTNLDRTKGGTTDELIKILGLENFVCESCNNEPPGFTRFVEFPEYVSVSDFIKRLKRISPGMRYVNNFNADKLKKIAFCAGSGSEFINEAVQKGADAFVTGDIKFHTALESSIVLFDIGHFESEIHVLKVFENLLKDTVEIVFAKENSPFTTIT